MAPCCVFGLGSECFPGRTCSLWTLPCTALAWKHWTARIIGMHEAGSLDHKSPPVYQTALSLCRGIISLIVRTNVCSRTDVICFWWSINRVLFGIRFSMQSTVELKFVMRLHLNFVFLIKISKSVNTCLFSGSSYVVVPTPDSLATF